MNDRSKIIAYFAPARPSFWKWDVDGKSVSWSTGETLAFRQELASMVGRLAPRGLPPFEAVVLLAAATRDNWLIVRDGVVRHLRFLTRAGADDPAGPTGVIRRIVGHRLDAACDELMEGLGRIHSLPEPLRVPLAAKACLADVIFEGSEPAVGADHAVAVAEELNARGEPFEFETLSHGRALREFTAALEALLPGLKQVDARRLELRLKTGLDELVRPADVTVDTAQQVRRLLSDLGDDPELGRLAQLARDLLAAVQTPRALHRREDYPVGGVADISNRGPLDRLLVSELAHDNLTLAVRVAVNEALYLQREHPRRDPPHSRIIVLDAGIRTWGVPRIFATAVAMALAATADRNAPVAVFRPEVDRLLPVDLTNRDGLIRHLAALDPRPHFGGALPALRDHVNGLTEVFMVTQQDVLGDPEFRAALAAQGDLRGFTAGVDRDGSFRLASFSPAGQKLLRQATLDLGRLLEQPKDTPRVTPLVGKNADLPTIFSIQPFPLLLPAAGLRRCVHDRRNGYVGITRDRRMLHWRNPGEGGFQLTEKLPPGNLDLLQITEDNQAVAVCTDTGRHGATKTAVALADLSTHEVSIYHLLTDDQIPIGATVRQGVLFLILKSEAKAYSLQNGTPLGTRQIGGRNRVRGRIFRFGRDFFVLAWNGTQVVFETLPEIPERALQVFESYAIDGPLLLQPDGVIERVGKPDEALCAAFSQNVSCTGISEDGRWVTVRLNPPRDLQYAIDLADVGSRVWANLPVGRNPVAGPASLPEGREVADDWGMLGILVDGNGTLILVGPQLVEVSVRVIDGELKLKKEQEPAEDNLRLRRFEPALPPEGAGYDLQVATWPNGSKAFLDQRGMLHLKESSPSAPQITIVLIYDGPLAAWTSDGHVFGPNAWHGRPTVWVAGHLEDLLRRFTDPLR